MISGLKHCRTGELPRRTIGCDNTVMAAQANGRFRRGALLPQLSAGALHHFQMSANGARGCKGDYEERCQTEPDDPFGCHTGIVGPYPRCLKGNCYRAYTIKAKSLAISGEQVAIVSVSYG